MDRGGPQMYAEKSTAPGPAGWRNQNHPQSGWFALAL